MPEQKLQFETPTPPVEPLSKGERAFALARRAWRQGGTALAVVLATMLMWHVINGKHGLSVWHQNHTQDHDLQRQINEIQQENAQLSGIIVDQSGAAIVGSSITIADPARGLTRATTSDATSAASAAAVTRRPTPSCAPGALL